MSEQPTSLLDAREIALSMLDVLQRERARSPTKQQRKVEEAIDELWWRIRLMDKRVADPR